MNVIVKHKILIKKEDNRGNSFLKKFKNGLQNYPIPLNDIESGVEKLS